MTAVHDADPRTACPAAGRLATLSRSHGSYRAARENGCTCPGAGQDSYTAYKAVQAERKRHKRGGSRVTAPDFWSPPVPEPTHEAGEFEAIVYGNPDRACLGLSVGDFFPVGSGGRFAREQEERAKAICAGCCVREACAAMAMRRGEPEGVWGGMSPADRRQARSGRREATR